VFPDFDDQDCAESAGRDDEGPALPEFGCCLPPGECCMPGLHFPSECHTAADYDHQHETPFEAGRP